MPSPSRSSVTSGGASTALYSQSHRSAATSRRCWRSAPRAASHNGLPSVPDSANSHAWWRAARTRSPWPSPFRSIARGMTKGRRSNLPQPPYCCWLFLSQGQIRPGACLVTCSSAVRSSVQSPRCRVASPPRTPLSSQVLASTASTLPAASTRRTPWSSSRIRSAPSSNSTSRKVRAMSTVGRSRPSASLTLCSERSPRASPTAMVRLSWPSPITRSWYSPAGSSAGCCMGRVSGGATGSPCSSRISATSGGVSVVSIR